MSNAQSSDSLKELNTKLITTIAELKKKLLNFDELEAENAKLDQMIAENAELKTEVARLRHDIEEIKQRNQVITNVQDAMFYL